MAGTKASGRPGGNPDLDRFQFQKAKSDREPYNKKLQFWVGETLITRLKAVPEWQEFARNAIQKALDELPEDPD